MADLRHSRVAKIYFDHFRVSQTVGASQQTVGRAEAEVPKLEGEKQFLPGKVGAGASSLNGFMDVAADGWDDVEDAFDGSIHYVARMPQGNAASAIAIETQERDAGDSRSYDQGNIALLNWNGQGHGPFYKGAVITAGEEVVSAAGPLTGYNRGALASTAIYVCTIRVVAVTGTGSITFRVEESSDNGGTDPYAQITGLTIAVRGNASAGTDEVTFTGTGVARLVAAAGAREAWRRLNVSAYATFTDVTVIATDGDQLAA